MLSYLVVTIYVITCMVLVLVILLQQGKGGDIANAFGGGASQAAFGARSGATVLSRATTVGAVIFVLGAIALGILGQRGPGSVLGGRRPATPPPAGATLPGTTAPKPAAPTTVPPSNNGVPAGQGAAPAPTPAAPAPVKK